MSQNNKTKAGQKRTGLPEEGTEMEMEPSELTPSQLSSVTAWIRSSITEMSQQPASQKSFLRAIDELKIADELELSSPQIKLIWDQISAEFKNYPYDPFDLNEQNSRMSIVLSQRSTPSKADVKPESKKPKVDELSSNSEEEEEKEEDDPDRTRNQRLNNITWHLGVTRNYEGDNIAKGFSISWFNYFQEQLVESNLTAYGDPEIAKRRMYKLAEVLYNKINSSKSLPYRIYWAIVEILRKCHKDFTITDNDFRYLFNRRVGGSKRFGDVIQQLQKNAAKYESRGNKTLYFDVQQNDAAYRKDKGVNHIVSGTVVVNVLRI